MIIMLTTEIHFQLEDTPAQKSSLVFTGRNFKNFTLVLKELRLQSSC